MAEPQAAEPAQTAEPAQSAPRSRVTVLAVILFLILLATGAFFLLPDQLAKVAPLASTAPLEAELAARRSELDALTWERPVLRGAPLAGDGGSARREAQIALTERRKALGFIHELIDKMRPRDASAELPQIADELEAARASLQYESVGSPWKRDLDRPKVFGATEALLIAAATQAGSARECLELLADRIRFAQDEGLGMGVGPVGMMASVTPLALACAERASDDELAAAAWEMHLLATHREPIARDQREKTLGHADAALGNARSMGKGLLDRLRGAGVHERSLAETRSWLDRDAALRDADDLGFPEIDRIVVAIYPDDSMHKPYGFDLAAHAEAEAELKMLALALSWLEGAWQAPDLPADEISRDPFSGEPLIVDRRADGSIALISVGTDGRRDPKRYGDDRVLEVHPRDRTKPSTH